MHNVVFYVSLEVSFAGSPWLKRTLRKETRIAELPKVGQEIEVYGFRAYHQKYGPDDHWVVTNVYPAFWDNGVRVKYGHFVEVSGGAYREYLDEKDFLGEECFEDDQNRIKHRSLNEYMDTLFIMDDVKRMGFVVCSDSYLSKAFHPKWDAS